MSLEQDIRRFIGLFLAKWTGKCHASDLMAITNCQSGQASITLKQLLNSPEKQTKRINDKQRGAITSNTNEHFSNDLMSLFAFDHIASQIMTPTKPFRSPYALLPNFTALKPKELQTESTKIFEDLDLQIWKCLEAKNDIVKNILNGIIRGYVIEATYVSRKRTTENRKILPIILRKFDGRIYVRSYDFMTKSYRDFSILRFLKTTPINIFEGSLPLDLDLNEIVSINYILSQELPEQTKLALSMEWNLENFELKIDCKRADIFYIHKFFKEKFHEENGKLIKVWVNKT